jgi:hypothetical protein
VRRTFKSRQANCIAWQAPEHVSTAQTKRQKCIGLHDAADKFDAIAFEVTETN